jgi:VIT1/CCC1 family predicted Fe2+/Mn2+ transporter
VKQSSDFGSRALTVFQKKEITDHHIYKNLSTRVAGVKNRRILAQIADDELRHYNVWKVYTRKDVGPSRFKIWFYSLVSMVFGFTFGVKLMEKGEKSAYDRYSSMNGSMKEINGIIRDEEEHEQALITLLDEDRLKYTGSIVLGLNDALVELTGALAGLTFVFQKTSVIAITASITGLAAALSMAASEYLSTKSEGGTRSPFRAAFYTGIAYIAAVLVLVTPYLFLTDIMASFGIAGISALCIIAFFNYYISVARDVPFRSRFFEMAGLILAIAGVSFGAGMAIRLVFGIEM